MGERHDEEGVWRRRLASASLHLRSDEVPAPKAQVRLRRILMRAADAVFDRNLRTRPPATRLLDHFHPENTVYEASGWTYLPRALRVAGVSRADVFADLGCGRGRVLYVAARFYPFRRVIGVDVSAELTDHARTALDRHRDDLRCSEVEVVCANARDWVVPDDLTIVYLYFPFSGDTLRAVVNNLVTSLERNPRRMRIIYAAPKQSDVLIESGRFHRVGTSRTLGDNVMSRIEVYESSAAAGDVPPQRSPDVITKVSDRLTPWWRRLIAMCRAMRALVSVRRALRAGGVKLAHASMRQLAVLREDERLVSIALRFGGATCLERTLILQAWYAGHGELRDLVIGVQRPGGELHAHAWLGGCEDEKNAQYHEIVRLAPHSHVSR